MFAVPRGVVTDGLSELGGTSSAHFDQTCYAAITLLIYFSQYTIIPVYAFYYNPSVIKFLNRVTIILKKQER